MIALASSYGLPGREVERAYERGLRSFFWGALRRSDFGSAVRRLARRDRDRITIAIQTYTRRPSLIPVSVEIARRRLGIDSIDVLGLGFWNEPPPREIVDRALSLRDRGLVETIVISCHHRPTFASLIDDDAYDAIMVRYNAAHTGAEESVLPLALARRKPVIAYTATRWGSLVDPGSMPEGERTPRASDCYRFVLSHPAIATCLAGPKDARELDGVLEALDADPMTADEQAWMRRVGAFVRASARIRHAPARERSLRGVWDHARGIARELRERGITEDLLSRFYR